VPCSYIKFNEDVPNSRIKDKKWRRLKGRLLNL
jgi:hypothetical protein